MCVPTSTSEEDMKRDLDTKEEPNATIYLEKPYLRFLVAIDE